MPRTTGVNKRKIQKLLSECAFSPTDFGPMRIIADVGDPQYYVTRAQEELRKTPPDLQFAIRLLALAKAESALGSDHATSGS